MHLPILCILELSIYLYYIICLLLNGTVAQRIDGRVFKNCQSLPVMIIGLNFHPSVE